MRKLVRMDTQGSIRASLKGSSSSFRPTPLEPTLLETAKQFLESFHFDLRIRQVLHEDKLEESVGKHTYYLLPNEQKYEPGFLLILQGKPILFVSSRFQFGFALRLRIHPSVFQKQAVFVATLDTIHATLRLEDILYDGNPVSKLPFSKRYSLLSSFYTNSFLQDKHLSGLHVSLAELYALDTLREKVDSAQFYSIDLVPEQGGRRRWHIPLRAPAAATTRPVHAPSTISMATSTVVEKLSIPASGKPEVSPTEAFAYKIKGMPDTYDLQDKKGRPLGKAAVQSAQLSLQLRNSFQGAQTYVPVRIQWNEEFSRFKILGIQDMQSEVLSESVVSSVEGSEGDAEHPHDGSS